MKPDALGLENPQTKKRETNSPKSLTPSKQNARLIVF